MREIYAGQEWDDERLAVRQVSGLKTDTLVLTSATGKPLPHILLRLLVNFSYSCYSLRMEYLRFEGGTR